MFGELDCDLNSRWMCPICVYNSYFVSLIFSDIVNCDLKSTLRVLYNLFTRYRNVD